MKKEFKETYGKLQATLEELNAIHAKWLHYQDKRIHRLHALGRDEYIATILKTISEDYQNWLDILSVYAIIHNTTITISCSDIEDVNVSDSLQSDAARFDHQVDWITNKAPAIFALLQRHARDRENKIVLREQFDKDVSFHVSPSPEGTITISFNKPSDDETVILSEILCPAIFEGPETKEPNTLQDEKVEETVLHVPDTDVPKPEEPVLQDEKSEEAESPVPDDPIKQFIILHVDQEALLAKYMVYPFPRRMHGIRRVS